MAKRKAVQVQQQISEAEKKYSQETCTRDVQKIIRLNFPDRETASISQLVADYLLDFYKQKSEFYEALCRSFLQTGKTK